MNPNPAQSTSNLLGTTPQINAKELLENAAATQWNNADCFNVESALTVINVSSAT